MKITMGETILFNSLCIEYDFDLFQIINLSYHDKIFYIYQYLILVMILLKVLLL